MHEHLIEVNGDLIDTVPFCSDACHKQWCVDEDEHYAGWNGCQETACTQYCANCGTVIWGFEDDGDDCQRNVVVNRFLSDEGVKCEHGYWLQVPRKFIGR